MSSRNSLTKGSSKMKEDKKKLSRSESVKTVTLEKTKTREAEKGLNGNASETKTENGIEPENHSEEKAKAEDVNTEITIQEIKNGNERSVSKSKTENVKQDKILSKRDSFAKPPAKSGKPTKKPGKSYSEIKQPKNYKIIKANNRSIEEKDESPDVNEARNTNGTAEDIEDEDTIGCQEHQDPEEDRFDDSTDDWLEADEVS